MLRLSQQTTLYMYSEVRLIEAEVTKKEEDGLSNHIPIEIDTCYIACRYYSSLL